MANVELVSVTVVETVEPSVVVAELLTETVGDGVLPVISVVDAELESATVDEVVLE